MRRNPGGNPGYERIISVCRVSKAHDGGAGGGKSISRGTESQVFRFNDKPSAQLGKFSFQFSVFSFQGAGCRVDNLEISSYSGDSFYSWFTIFAFFDKNVIHESNAVFRGLA